MIDVADSVTAVRPFVDSSALLARPQQLRRRYLADGFVLLRGLLPAGDLEAVMHSMLDFAREEGWLVPGSSAGDRVAVPEKACVEPEPSYRRAWDRAYRLRALHALGHAVPLLDAVGMLLGGAEVLVHPKKIPRYVFPIRSGYDNFTTPAHQDHRVVQGSTNGLTAWFPLHDCPRENGVLMVARASHGDGLRPYEVANGAGGTSVVGQESLDWCCGDMRRGDVIAFSTLAVHKAWKNSSSLLRLSVDCRYQPATEPVCSPTLGLEEWNDVYAGWPPDDELRLYWKRLPLDVVPFDNTYHRSRDLMALQEAARGNRAAVSALHRIVAFGRDELHVQEARRLLAELTKTGGSN